MHLIDAGYYYILVCLTSKFITHVNTYFHIRNSVSIDKESCDTKKVLLDCITHLVNKILKMTP